MTTSRPEPLRAVVHRVVDERVDDLQKRLLHPVRRDPAAVAALARLRRAVGKEPDAVPDVFEFTLHDDLVRTDEPDEPNPAERATHLAITLYATHQQSKSERMHRLGKGLGAALRSLHRGDEKSLPPPLVNRFIALCTAGSFDELSYHLRGAVQLLRAGGAPLDYSRLAEQLLVWQLWDRDQVQLVWGREFYRTARSDESADQSAV